MHYDSAPINSATLREVSPREKKSHSSRTNKESPNSTRSRSGSGSEKFPPTIAEFNRNISMKKTGRQIEKERLMELTKREQQKEQQLMNLIEGKKKKKKKEREEMKLRRREKMKLKEKKRKRETKNMLGLFRRK